MTRNEVYALLDGERLYQNRKWNESTTTSGNHHSFEEWLTYIEHYVREAQLILSTHAKQNADEMVRHTIRKITALGVAAMEDMGAYPRTNREAK